MRIYKVLLLSACAWVAFGLCAYATSAKPSDLVGKESPDFRITTLQGETLGLRELLKDKRAVVLSFWGLRCGACIQEMPVLDVIYNSNKDRVAMVGINVDGVDAEYIRKEMKELELTPAYLIAPDKEFALVESFKMTAAPLVIVIDKTGTVRYVHYGFKKGDEKEVREAIEKYVNE